MTRVWSIVRWVVVALIAVALVAAVAGLWTVRRSFPQVAGEATLAALDGDVTVRRDEWGVARLYGDSVEDLVRAQGYVHAQDRFWEMDVRRHVTAGRLSELFGEGQLDTDRYIRTLGWRRVAEAELDLLDERSLRLLEAYAAGVNAYLADRSPAELSLEYAVLGLTGTDVTVEPWTPADSVAWLKAMAWDLRSNPGEEVSRALLSASLPRDRVEELFPAYPFDRFDPILSTDGASITPALARGVDATSGGIGSNSWAVAGSLTDSGGALLANDPHLAPSQPGIWYQVGLHCRQRSPDCPLDVSGFGFAGMPGVVIGRNDRIAWGFTNLAADVADHYVERVDGDRYQVDGEWRDMAVRSETIEIAGGDPVELTVRETRHGPVLSDVDEELRDLLATADLPDVGVVGAEGHAVSLQWTALEPGRTFDAVWALNSAGDFDEFRAAADLYEVPAQNLLYADVDGHIGYQAPGRHPIRAAGHDGRWPVAGWTTDNDWQGFVDFEDLPSVLDPDEGFIATANEPVVGPDAEVGLEGSYAPGFRAARIDELLRDALADGRATTEEMAAIQGDDRILLADVLVPALLDVAAGDTTAAELDDGATETVATLDGWDGSMAVDSAPAAVLAVVYRQLLLATFADEVPDDLEERLLGDRGDWWLLFDDLLDRPDAAWWDDVTTTDVEEGRDDVLRAAIVAADEELRERLGDDVTAWRWGDLHTLTATHGTLGQSGVAPVEALFNRGPYETRGSGSVVTATGWTPTEGYEITWVPSMRMVVDTARPDAARWINLTGQSGHAYHPHYDDMTPLWARNETVPWLGTAAAVEAATTDTLVLRP